MVANPAEVMRSYIIDMDTLNLAEQAGMFCEALKENLRDLSPFEGTRFIYSPDEPYEVHFIWDKGDIRIQLSFMGDPDDSVWTVINGKRRFRGRIGNDRETSCREFLRAVDELR